MTAEIAVMNKAAVALAADSAITLEFPGGKKIYNTADKLFPLSKYHPVGVMIYGAADFMGVPWETIVKAYRTRLGTRCFPSLGEYADGLLDYLRGEDSVVAGERREEYVYMLARTTYMTMCAWITKAVRHHIDEHGSIAKSKVVAITREVIGKHHKQLEGVRMLDGCPEGFVDRFLDKYSGTLKAVEEKVFQQLPRPDDVGVQLKNLVCYRFCKDYFPKNTSGVVVAGFGTNDVFPELRSFQVDCVLDGFLKYKAGVKHRITGIDDALIVPFAQTRTVITFMEGFDPSLKEFFHSALVKLFDEYPAAMMDALPDIPSATRNAHVDKLRKISRSLADDLMARAERFADDKNARPVVTTVSMLPKDELAQMAEALVSLTSLRQRVSTDHETVGGAIDVCVISKGDGFIWIKRKHYFSADRNPIFFENYFRESEGTNGNPNSREHGAQVQ